MSPYSNKASFMKQLLNLWRIVIIAIFILFFLTCRKNELQAPQALQAPNNLPVSYAGQDQLIILPANSTTLDGTQSRDPQGKIKSYNWTKSSGPDEYTIDSPTAPKTTVRNLVHGIYEFVLQVTDEGGLSSTDTVKVTLDRLPVANAGKDQTFILKYCNDNSNQIVLDGSASYDPDSSALTYHWNEISGPRDLLTINHDGPKIAILNTNDLISNGEYSFELTVQDPEGSFSRDTVNLSIKGSPLAYDLNITINAVYSFTDSAEPGSGGYYSDTTTKYFYYTSLNGKTNFPPLGDLMVNISETADTGVAYVLHNTSIYIQVDSSLGREFIIGSCSVNFKQLISNGGGPFNGILEIDTGSASGCDNNALISLVPLQVTGSLNKATGTITMTINGKVYF